MKVLKLGDVLRPAHGLMQPRAGPRLAVAPEGLDLGILNAPPIPFSRIRALVTCSATLQGFESPALILFVDWTERPFMVDAARMDRASFGLAAALRPEEALRLAIRGLAPRLPQVVVDDATAQFLRGGKPLRQVGERFDDLANTMTEALKRVPASAVAPPAGAPAPVVAPAPVAPAPVAPAPVVAPSAGPPSHPRPQAAFPPPAAPPPTPASGPQAPLAPGTPPGPGARGPASVEAPPAAAPVLWFDELSGAIAYLTASKIVVPLVSVKPADLGSTLDAIRNRGGDPQAVPGLATTAVPLRAIREIARDVKRRKVDIRYAAGRETPTARIRYYSEHNMGSLLASLQEKLGVTFSDHEQNPDDVRWRIAGAWLTGLILASFTFLTPALPHFKHGRADFSNVAWWEAAIPLGLAIGIYLNSRACALVLFLLYTMTKIYQWVQLDSLRPVLPGIAISIVIAYFLLMGVAGTARYHELKVIYRKGDGARVPGRGPRTPP